LDSFFEAQRARVARSFESHVDRVRRHRFDSGDVNASTPNTEKIKGGGDDER
jgi:hypothetical protein